MGALPDDPESASAAPPTPEDADATRYGQTPTADPAATRYSDDPLATRYSGADARLSLPPQSVPGYEILGELGRGGMGVVYQARHVKLDRVVALKMILAGGHAGEADLARFKTEAEAVARIQHPGIVQIFEVGEHDGLPFIAPEFCPGGGLDKKLNGTPLPPKEAAALVEKLARAVQAAHEKGVIHRDLKPANVLLAEDGTPKITDFGLAKKLDAAGQTHTGAVMGTPSYMAPEQADGKSKEIGPACDIYALGAILYECLTGRPPFKAATLLDTLVQVRQDDPVPPRQLQPKTPRDLETVCLKCLRKEPKKRYASAAEFAEDLRRFQAGEPVKARPVGVFGRAGKWVRRRPMVVTLLAALAAVAAVGFGGIWSQYGEAVRQRDEAQSALADTRILLADAAGRDGATDQALRLLDEVPEGLRGWEWGYLRRNVRRSICTFLPPGGAFRVAFSPDGRRLATNNGNLVQIWDAETGQLQRSLGPASVGDSAAFSPDGLRLAVGGGQPTVWDVETGQPLLRLPEPAPELVFSPDGRRLAANGGEVWDARTGQLLLRLQAGPDTKSVGFSPDGSVLVTAAWPMIRLWDLYTGKLLRAYQLHSNALPDGAYPADCAFSPDGRLLARGIHTDDFDIDKGAVAVFDQSGRQLAKLGTACLKRVAFSPDGQRLATVGAGPALGARGPATVWDLKTGEPLLILPANAEYGDDVTFSPDGQRLATTSFEGPVTVWDLRGGRPLLSLQGPATGTLGVAFGPDSRRLGAASPQAKKEWDALTGRPFPDLRLPTSGDPNVAISADGRFQATCDASGVTLRDLKTGVQTVVYALHPKLDTHDSMVDFYEPATASGVAFRPDGRRLVSAETDGMASVWEVNGAKVLLTLPGPSYVAHFGGQVNWTAFHGVTRVAYSPDGLLLATAHKDALVRLWDANTGQPITTFRGHARGVNGVAFSPDGRRLVSAGEDATVRVWDAKNGQPLLTLQSHTGGVTGVAFSPDGRLLAAACRDGTVKVWYAGTDEQPLMGHKEKVSSVRFQPGWDAAEESG